MKKKSIYLLGLVTLLVFPLPTFIGLYFFEDVDPLSIFQLDKLSFFNITIGLELGLLYAAIALLIMRAPIFEAIPTRVDHLVKSMNLSIWDCIFLSVCAGVGEELLFRSGVQYYLGPILTSIIFVAIHGYLNPFNWKMSLYGVIVLPFIFLISYGFYTFGLWFSIAAHFAYDLLLFIVMTREKD